MKMTNKSISSKVVTALMVVLILASCNEIFDAFKIVNKELTEEREQMHTSNEELKSKLVLSKYKSEVDSIEMISHKYNSLIDSTINQLVYQTGGYKKGTKELANPENKSIPTKILVTDRLGYKIQDAISSTSMTYQNVLTKMNADTLAIPLTIVDKINGRSWVEYSFDQMPLMSVIPVLRVYQNHESRSKNILYQVMHDDLEKSNEE